MLAARSAADDPKPEVISPLGARYFAKPDDQGDIARAEAAVAADPRNVEKLLALGRAQAATWRFHDAIATYTRAMELAPGDARLYRHRGHRWISVRRFDDAVVDLKRAAELNDRDFDIWYHLGLAHYLRGDFAAARPAYERCDAIAERERAAAPADKDGRDDSLVAVSDWLVMTCRRLNQPAEAARILDRITPDMKVKENKAYFDRLLFYKGLKSEADLVDAMKTNDLDLATIGYGVGNWHGTNGDRAKAEAYYRRVASGKSWPAFGFIAAEAELARGSRP
jgi:tetratricopeptide (TPR) repeat protein